MLERAEHAHGERGAWLEGAVHLVHVGAEPEGRMKRRRHGSHISVLPALLLLLVQVLLLQVRHVLQPRREVGTRQPAQRRTLCYHLPFFLMDVNYPNIANHNCTSAVVIGMRRFAEPF